jgi:hypothetical protein
MAIVVQPAKAKSASVVPNGTYKAKLTNIKQFENSYGTRLGFEFTIQEGDQDGATIMRSTSPNLSRQSKLAELLRGLLGRALDELELTSGMDVEELVGTECQILVLQSKGKNGQLYSNVEQVFK